jgi:hypothetical protein
MIFLKLTDDYIECESGYGSALAVTRYFGEHWDRVASDLLCGVADVFQDVGIVITQKIGAALLERFKKEERWTPIGPSSNVGESLWSFSEEHGWLFVPSCREAVEFVSSRTWGAHTEAEAAIFTVFQGYRAFRDLLISKTWNVQDGDLQRSVKVRCIDRSLFHMKWGPCIWQFFPDSIELLHLLRLVDPVVARVNTAYSE